MSGKNGRFDREYAYLCGRIAARSIDPLVQKLAYVGSFRRLLPTLGDVDILIVPKVGVRESQINTEFARVCINKKLESFGSGLSIGLVSPESESDAVPINLFFTREDEWGAALMYSTGSRDYNIGYRSFAKKHYGLTVNQYGVFRKGELVPDSGYSERAVTRAIGIPWLPPQDRTDRRLFPR